MAFAQVVCCNICFECMQLPAQRMARILWLNWPVLTNTDPFQRESSSGARQSHFDVANKAQRCHALYSAF